MRRPWVTRHSWVVVGCGVLGAGIVLGLALFHPEALSESLKGVSSAKDRAPILASGRDFGLKLAAGIGTVAAAVLAWGRFELSKEERDVARLTVDIARLTVDAERFSRAVDQLGSDKGSDVILGGLYALEALGNSARDYQSQITEVLSAFVRQHAGERQAPRADEATVGPMSGKVTAALTILSRQNMSWLGTIDLSLSDLTDAHLAGAHLSRAVLTGAYLARADLTDAYLARADLTDAHLAGARLSRADFAGADLTGADLTGADLTGDRLTDANLTRADLTRARLTGANLTGADLTAADLTGANLTDARHNTGPDGGTVWPKGFDPTTAGL